MLAQTVQDFLVEIHSPTADLVRGVPCLSVSLPPPWSITGLLENDGNYDRLGHWISKPYALRTYKYICTNPTAVVRWRVSATAAPHLSNHRLVQEGSDPLRLYWAQKLSFCMGQWRWHTSGTHRIPDAHISEPRSLASDHRFSPLPTSIALLFCIWKMDPDNYLLGFGNFNQGADLFPFLDISLAAVPQTDDGFSIGDEIWQLDAPLAAAPTPATQPLPGPMLPPAQAPLSATRSRRKAPTLRDRDWDRVKDRIVHLYKVEGKSLKDVKSIVEQEFQFEATCVLLITHGF